MEENMAMRFILAVFVAMALTILWQTAVLAEITGSKPSACVSESGMIAAGGQKKKSGSDEPECE
ncbi:MAG: hypothetical protein KDI82_03230 [Gammaproteobacteria bacterium]|nr:hypothetical protein [Gammaproteobacteria bacterium]